MVLEIALKVDQGHWQWHNSTGHISLSISANHCVYLVLLLKYSTNCDSVC